MGTDRWQGSTFCNVDICTENGRALREKEADEYLGKEPSTCKGTGVRAPGETERQWSPEGLGWSV